MRRNNKSCALVIVEFPQTPESMRGFLLGGEHYQTYESPYYREEWPNIHPHRKPDVLDENGQTEWVEMRATAGEDTGNGLFARQAIRARQGVFVFDGKRNAYDLREPFSSSYYLNSIVVGREPLPGGGLHGPRFIWVDPSDKSPLRWVNHQCDNPTMGRSNKGYKDPFQLVALRDIQQGEQLTADYSLLETNPDWRMACACDSEACRGEIRSIVHLDPTYIAKHWDSIIPCIQEWGVKESRNAQIQEAVAKYGWKQTHQKFVGLFLSDS